MGFQEGERSSGIWRVSSSRRHRRSRATQRKSASAGTHRTEGDRVHLSLVTEPASGHEQLALSRSVFLEEWQDRVVAATANTAFAVLRRQGTATEMVALARQSMSSTSKLIDGLLDRAPAGSVACRAGCDHCCRQSVGLTPLELFAIVAHLATTRSDSQLAALRAHVSLLAKRASGLSSRERVAQDLPCPLLDEGKCSIYEVRPLSCRGMNSLDAGICQEKLREGPTREAFFAGTLEGHVFVEPIRAFHAISAGLQLALSECFGLDMRPLDLTASLDLVLSADETVSKAAQTSEALLQPLHAWLQRKPSLAEARGGDASAQLGHWELAGVASPRSQD